jgi:hypothetical protein
MNAWGINPQTVSVVLNVLLLIGVFAAVWQARTALAQFRVAAAQLKSAESARRAQLLFHVWEKYEDAQTRDDVRNLTDMLKEHPCSTLVEFNTSAQKFKQLSGKEQFDADQARRRLKFILAPLGYMLKFGIATPEELFPIVPAVIRLWGQGLRNIELQLLNHTGGLREYELGYDPVAMVNFLFEQYSQRVNKGKDESPPCGSSHEKGT